MLNDLAIWALWALTLLFALATVLPLSKIPFGFIRGGEFPREQIFMLSLLFGALFPLAQPGRAGWAGSGILGLVALTQLFYIVKFTPIWPRQSVRATAALAGDESARISMLPANVKKSNRDFGRLIAMIEARKPDIAMAIETDDEWIAALKDALGDSYPHWVEVPLDNGYGLCVMSRLKLSDTEVREVIVEDVPSVRTVVTLRNGARIRLYVVHPEPPVIDHDTKGRDSEIALVGMEAEEDPLPAIVTGDLNDVAWSTTTRRFQRLSGLLDPRVGRGFYNTFSATMPWMRWPLDHMFHDPRFRLVEMERLGKIGSDHFPMWFVLALARSEATESEIEPCEPEERREAREMIVEERARDREAIGSDWEDED